MISRRSGEVSISSQQASLNMGVRSGSALAAGPTGTAAQATLERPSPAPGIGKATTATPFARLKAIAGVAAGARMASDVARAHAEDDPGQALSRPIQGAAATAGSKATSAVTREMVRSLRSSTQGAAGTSARGAGSQIGRTISSQAGRARIVAGRSTRAVPARVLRGTVTKGATASAQVGRVVAQGALSAGRALATALASAVSGTAGLSVLCVILAIVLVLMALPFINVFLKSQDSRGQAFSGGLVEDDYPYKGQYSDDAMSPLGYAYGNCTDFVAWRINRDAGVRGEPWQFTWSALTPNGGDGKDWGDPGNLPGWEDTTKPVPGDIFSVPAGTVGWGSSGGPYGHVGYVGQVFEDGSYLLENYGNGSYFLLTVSAQDVASAGLSGVKFRHNPANTMDPALGGAPTGDLSTPEGAQSFALQLLTSYGWNDGMQGSCLIELWTGESAWRWDAENPSSGAYGIPQALPGDKMTSHGADWRTNPEVQIRWGLDYIRERYGGPCNALHFWQDNNPRWY